MEAFTILVFLRPNMQGSTDIIGVSDRVSYWQIQLSYSSQLLQHVLHKFS